MSKKLFTFTGIEKIPSISDCKAGSIGIGFTSPILYSSSLDKPPGSEKIRKPIVIFFLKKKAIRNTITIYVEDNDRYRVDSNGESNFVIL